MPCLIYCFTNKTNGKKYVGQTWQKLGRRLNAHKNENRSNSRLHLAIEKYGIANFDVAILATVSSQDDADRLESFWIAILDTLDGGYNLTQGGQGRGKIFSGESRKKMSDAKQGVIPWSKGAIFTDEHRKNISTNHARPCLGKIHTEESREKMRKTLALGGKGKKITQEIADNIRANYITGEFSQVDLSKKYNLSRANICMIVNNKIW
jgi:group I intron endonuclease